MIPRSHILCGIALPFAFFLQSLAAPACSQQTETIVCIRHGEKPSNEIGQITGQGLNRALALPDVLAAKYPNPKFIFAPGTTDKIKNHQDEKEYSYIRPLITIEPTAIRLGMPINTDFGYHDFAGLESELLKDTYKDAVVYVAWEHLAVQKMVAKLVSDLGGHDTVPEWPNTDYDSIYVITIRNENGTRSVSFRVDHEGITPSQTFPTPAK